MITHDTISLQSQCYVATLCNTMMVKTTQQLLINTFIYDKEK